MAQDQSLNSDDVLSLFKILLSGIAPEERDAFTNPQLAENDENGQVRSEKQRDSRYQADTVVNGYRFVAPKHPSIAASQAAFLTVHVTDPNGKPAHFVPWFGALAHAIFFRAGTLDYFHSHVCAPGATSCTSFVGATRIAGKSTSPGKLTIGVLVPTPGTWKLFLQSKPGGRLVTVPYVLKVR